MKYAAIGMAAFYTRLSFAAAEDAIPRTDSSSYYLYGFLMLCGAIALIQLYPVFQKQFFPRKKTAQELVDAANHSHKE
ncbi:MAG: hypothetical protein A2X94_14480 [Bdellovibrionales bacterium GWB1_55_8]|nr:MAG: hypothetical protein A2X94_14480 [Bdellovibrionales bacterium GWB1_55_8]